MRPNTELCFCIGTHHRCADFLKRRLILNVLGWNSPDTTNLVPILTLVATKTQLPSSILGPKITTKSVVVVLRSSVLVVLQVVIHQLFSSATG